MRKKPSAPRLRDLPLWRLLVALADAERAFGPTDHTTLRIADAVQERLANRDVRSDTSPKGDTDA